MRILSRALLLLATTVLFAEGILQFASLFAFGRTVGELDGHEVVLCVGDSHTYGAMVDETESYPAQLEGFLEELAPGRFKVLNLGIPGRSTTLVIGTLQQQISRYSPSAVIVWAGVNDGWNKTGVGRQSSSFYETIESFAFNMRLFKLYRTWRHDREIDSTLSRPIVMRAGNRKQVLGVGYSEDYEVEEYTDVRTRGDEQISARLRANYREIEHLIRQAQATPLFITYPLESGVFVQPNEAMRRAPVPLIVSKRSVDPLPAEQKRLLWAKHPTKFMYRAIARDVAKQLMAALGPTVSTAE